MISIYYYYYYYYYYFLCKNAVKHMYEKKNAKKIRIAKIKLKLIIRRKNERLRKGGSFFK